MICDVASISQGVNDGDFPNNIDQAGENVPTHQATLQLITRAISEVGALTVTAVVHTMHSQPSSGLFFGRNKFIYNVTLAFIFSLGVAENFTGMWISMSGLTYRRCLWLGGIILFLSMWPLIAILGIEGFA